MGHVRNYTIGDVITRFMRMQGYNVLQPMGWDAFGLPAENAAMKNSVPPAKWTYDNIAYMKRSCWRSAPCIDWDRELATCQPEYYRWNQWLFLRMLEKGVAYKKTGVVNWDPVDQTVLANEQVIDGRGWRTGALVEKREIPDVLPAHHRLCAGPARCAGGTARLARARAHHAGELDRPQRRRALRVPARHQDQRGELIGDGRMYVFTTRADTIMGVTFCAVAAEHPLATHAAQGNPELAAFVEECKHGTAMEAELAVMEKKGMPTGLSVTHPLSGEQIPVWVGNYVLMGYGDGAVMGVPAHDERDFEFANKYGLPIRQVLQHTLVYTDELQAAHPRTDYAHAYFDSHLWKVWYAAKSEHEVLVCNSGKYDGLSYLPKLSTRSRPICRRRASARSRCNGVCVTGVSRASATGAVRSRSFCVRQCGDVPVPDKDLPVVLPEGLVPDGSGNPLSKTPSFYECKCPKCGGRCPARNRHDGHVRRFVVVFRALRQRGQRTRDGR